MTQRTILKSFYIFSISLLILLTGASCDENNNIFDGADSGDKPLNGDEPLNGDPSPTPAPTPKPVLNFTGMGIDYDPEARCSTNNWSTDFPVACSPQVGFTCPAMGSTLDNCPTMCQACYDSDLDTIKNTLSVDTITIYQPNYYILTAAENEGVKAILGLFNDSVAALAARQCSNDAATMCVTDSDCSMGGTCIDASSGCTFGGSPALCGTGHANSILNGACFTTTPWPASMFCEAAGAYITPNADFISDGTVIGIQLGNEVLSSSDPSLTKQQVVNAAQVLRNAINNSSDNLPNIPIIVSLVVGNEQNFCESGAPPKGVDYIAAHPYCDFVASVPPMWPDEAGNSASVAASMCWTQVKSLFEDNAVMYCGAGNTYIGETGYNTGCPMSMGESTHLAVTPHFVDDALSWTCDQSIGTFLFAFVDACPMGGCLAGCSGSATTAGNGYFGLYHTDMYNTMGSLTAKYDPLPTLTCP
jgi:hypothetical protein